MTQNNNGANLGFENKLWEIADKMRGHMDAGEYKHVVLGRFAAAEGKGGIDADLGRHHADSFHNDLHKDLKADKRKGLRDRKGEMLFIDARKMGTLVDRVHRELTNDDLDLISDTYHEWRNTGGKYEDKADQLEAVIRKNLEVLGYGK